MVSVYPALNPDHEALALRSAGALPLRYDIRAAVTRDGAILSGADSVRNYQKVRLAPAALGPRPHSRTRQRNGNTVILRWSSVRG